MTLNPRDEGETRADPSWVEPSSQPVPRPHEGLAHVEDDPEQLALIREAHIGPLPPAAEFERYNRGTDDAADRILQMAEKSLGLQVDEAHHRMDMERLAAERQHEIALRDADRMDLIRQDGATEAARDSTSLTRAQYSAGGIVTLFVGSSVTALFLHEPWAAAGLGATAMVGVVTAFLNPRLFGRRDEQDDVEAGPTTPSPPDEPRDQLEPGG